MPVRHHVSSFELVPSQLGSRFALKSSGARPRISVLHIDPEKAQPLPAENVGVPGSDLIIIPGQVASAPFKRRNRSAALFILRARRRAAICQRRRRARTCLVCPQQNESPPRRCPRSFKSAKVVPPSSHTFPALSSFHFFNHQPYYLLSSLPTTIISSTSCCNLENLGFVPGLMTIAIYSTYDISFILDTVTLFQWHVGMGYSCAAFLL